MGSARMLLIMHVKHLFVHRAESQQKQMRRLTTAILHIVPQSGWRFLPVKFDKKKQSATMRINMEVAASIAMVRLKNSKFLPLSLGDLMRQKLFNISTEILRVSFQKDPVPVNFVLRSSHSSSVQPGRQRHQKTMQECMYIFCGHVSELHLQVHPSKHSRK